MAFQIPSGSGITGTGRLAAGQDGSAFGALAESGSPAGNNVSGYGAGVTTGSTLLSPAIQTIWSKEILFQAMPVLRFEQFAVKKTELGVMPGLTVNFMRYNNLPIPSGPPGSVQIEVRFSYDINGLLEVDVHIPKTGEKRDLVIADEAVKSDADFEKRRAALAALKQHPRDTDANRTLTARANRCYEESLGDDRVFIAREIQLFEGVLERQDPRDIEQARTRLTEVLDRFEGETWL